MKERFKIIPSVYLILMKGNKILLARRYNTGYEDGKYSLPAGHAEEHETMRKAVAREVKEEIGIKIEEDDLKLTHTMHRSCGDHERIDFFFTVKKYQGEIKNMEENKCDDLQWFPINRLPVNLIPYIAKAIHCSFSEIIYSEFGWKK